jgi:hypothetical protein
MEFVRLAKSTPNIGIFRQAKHQNLAVLELARI